LLGQLARPDRDVIADFEAGLGTVLRLDGHPVDVVLIVVEPTVKSLEVGRRAAESVTASGLGLVVVTANRVRSIEDEVRVRETFPGLDPVLVPDDPAIVDAERHGLAPLDAAPDSPGVRALVDLAESILSVG